MKLSEFYFDEEDGTISTHCEDVGSSLEICTVAALDNIGGRWFHGENSKKATDLIIAAPALLEALEYLMKCPALQQGAGVLAIYVTDEQIDKAGSAIKQARGE